MVKNHAGRLRNPYVNCRFRADSITLTTDELSKINSALAAIKIVGERYSAQIQEATGRK